MTAEFSGYQLSVQQRYLLSIEATAAGTTYAQSVFALDGLAVTDDALLVALGRVVARHEILRTTFGGVLGSFDLQVVADAGSPPEVRALPDAPDPLAAAARAQREAPFDLARGPLVRFAAARPSPERLLLLVTMSAAVGDGRSLEILAGELDRALDLHGQPAPSGDEEVIQFAQFAEWQAESLTEESDAAQRGRAAWSARAAERAVPLVLPLERAHGTSLPPEPVGRVAVPLPAATVDAIRAAAQRAAVSVEAVVLASWQTLLWRLTGRTEVLVGVVCDGRTLEDLARTIGPCSKVLPVERRFGERVSPHFADLVADAATQLRSAAGWQDFYDPTLAPGGGRNARPRIGFHWHAVDGAPGRRVAVAWRDCNLDAFVLALFAVDTGAELSLALTYDPRMVDAAAAARHAASLSALLTHAVQSPDRLAERLDVLGDAERRRLLVELNATGGARPAEATAIHRLIEAQAARTPDAVAVRDERTVLTYAELNRRANRVARRLRAAGVGPESFVALYVERSAEMLVGVLGVLKAGGAYVPLDPAYPEERTAMVLRDARVVAVVADAALPASLDISGVATVELGSASAGAGVGESDGDANVPGSERGASLAYVIYTSGSTGVPKGVGIAHASVCHYVGAIGDLLEIGSGDVYLQSASISFSASVRQTLVPLARGATVFIAPRARLRDPLMLLRLVKEQGVTVMDTLPTYWRTAAEALARLDEPERAELTDNKLRLIVTTGEPMTADIPAAWAHVAPHPSRAVNLYGQTETCGTVNALPFALPPPGESGSMPFGRPLRGTRNYVLDRLLQPVPVGVPGELYVGGPGLARGYLNQPKLTAERFVPDPFGTEPGARLYKTADIVRYLPDGSLEFLDRADDRVKVRGMRVELREVAAALTRHPRVGETFVAAVEDGAGGRRIAAYVVAAQPSLTVNELRDFLALTLADYMLPDAVLFLPTLPRTPNGKIDRAALPRPEQGRTGVGAAYVAPRSPVEEALARIWSKLLRIERIGVDDDFFALGGHSLMATELVYLIREEFHVELPVVALFENPTIARLAVTIAVAQAERAEAADLEALLDEIEQAPPDASSPGDGHQ